MPAAPHTPEVKALTVQAPWGHAIAAGIKRVENRNWRTAHRGIVLIHTGCAADGRRTRTHYPDGSRIPQRAWDERSRVVAVTLLHDIVANTLDADGVLPLRDLPWLNRSKYAWCLKRTVALPRPVPCRGMLGLWDPRRHPDVPDLAERCLQQLPAGWLLDETNTPESRLPAEVIAA